MTSLCSKLARPLFRATAMRLQTRSFTHATSWQAAGNTTGAEEKIQPYDMEPQTKALFDNLITGDRRSLAKAITLVESSKEAHKKQAHQLLANVMLHNSQMKDSKRTFRIGLSGPPGTGKSTFIEAFGMYLLDKGMKVSVLAVDPSSTRTGGSILGDKTRMEQLSIQNNAYIRPTPSRGSLGGVARNTNDAIVLCEANGYDICLVETVGVGQSETMVANMVDMFVLLVPPGGGDELQGMKRGIIELSDLIIVNKADGELKNAAKYAQLEYKRGLAFIQPSSPNWMPKTTLVSSREKTGLDKAWKYMTDFKKAMEDSGEFDQKRAQQRKKWMWKEVTESLLHHLHTNTEVQDLIKGIEGQVISGQLASGQAADKVLECFMKNAKF
ncbi:putative LAO/AO transport system kinase [Basidiobolus meristosporus CBS 931.73]|uniref:Putative LAO/AO transport system kinase n=1 Tax=Basidiobolus meristosporus CBS 931.73 TaxID=1314790 RepID=A0A1Y1Z5U6_9FUNG|nr:putative LAO/AO transport system kinase [Basidiobolus meristosporus CBS 931.73]|eukprot:ORY05629.1 putative LAO/AO transport system kinase [Basidiobolus meristosporus CBS 931.73]